MTFVEKTIGFHIYIYISFCSILEEYLGAGFNPLSQRMAEKQQKYHQPDS